ncbi:YxeA family protein [Paenibacillus sp. MZ04-78.2]|uniref:YxeA family protein n=1 Tax=Paenibacillus sp. MZ04-78.2 TaxID=2962034 RepID=UPI0020B8B0CF|nr:YxeA family protein [Paenibacillus sp. MZ04-78.2]MCP3776171.1 YxeA family protein [Paenibacillus sp. MZ04-78.2]
MKKIIISCIGIAALLFGGLFFLQNINLNRLGADVYYTQVQGQGKKLENKIDNGEIMVRYEYELSALDKNGQQKTLKFSAPKQLREKAYLSLFVKEGKGVTSYQEVAKEELPGKASQQLQ